MLKVLACQFYKFTLNINSCHTLYDQKLRKCFESQDIELLQKTVAEMPQEEAKYHIERCIDSGLWVPGGGDDDKTEEAKEGESASGATKESGDEVYDEVN